MADVALRLSYTDTFLCCGPELLARFRGVILGNTIASIEEPLQTNNSGQAGDRGHHAERGMPRVIFNVGQVEVGQRVDIVEPASFLQSVYKRISSYNAATRVNIAECSGRPF